MNKSRSTVVVVRRASVGVIGFRKDVRLTFGGVTEDIIEVDVRVLRVGRRSTVLDVVQEIFAAKVLSSCQSVRTTPSMSIGVLGEKRMRCTLRSAPKFPPPMPSPNLGDCLLSPGGRDGARAAHIGSSRFAEPTAKPGRA